MPPLWNASKAGPAARLSFWIVIALVCVVVLLAVQPEGAVQAVVTGVLGAAVFEALRPLAAAWNNLKLAYDTNRPSRRKAEIRLSMSYLYRLRLGDQYLLVEGDRIPGLQPVGGVFKRLPGAAAFFDEIGVRDDDRLEIDAGSKDDLRVRMEGRRVLAFLRWYESGEAREVETWREFYEELVRPGILPAEDFPYLLTRCVGRYRTPVRWSDHFQCWELLLAEIVEPVLTERQQQALEDLRDRGNSRIAWVSEELIRSRGFDRGAHARVQTISESSAWIL